MKPFLSILWLFIFNCLLLFPPSVPAQNYFKLIEQPANGYYQRLSQFPNGDILVGDKYYSNGNIQDRGFFLARINVCGEVIWANTYHVLNELLTFTQTTINSKGEIFVIGELVDSSISGDGYILKLTGEGQAIACKSYDAYQKEHPYSLSYKNDKLIITGFSFDQPSIDKSYYVLTMDDELNILSGRKFQPFDAYGEATMTSDDGVVYITGNKIIKVDFLGNTQWSKELLNSTGFLTFSIPLEVADGFVFGISENGNSWFFKLDFNGDLVWKSRIVPSFYHVFNSVILESADILSVYHRQTSNGNIPCFLILSPDGEILEQYQLDIDFPINSGFTYLTLYNNSRVNLLGNANMNAFVGEHSQSDFLMQFDLNQLSGDCFSWEEYAETKDNTFDLQFGNITNTTSDAPFNLMSEDIIVSSADYLITDICEFEKAAQIITEDTLLACETHWEITLPNDEFVWQDGSMDNPRNLLIPGTYIAEFEDCAQKIKYEFQLEKEACVCNIFIPNAFSPNQDGINDELEIFSNCEITQIEMSVFDRWGALVFSTQFPGEFWNGNFRGKKVNSGVYVLIVKIQTRDSINESSYFEKYQTVTVL